MPVAKLIAAAALVILAGAPREFGIGGGAILCVPERELDADAMPYAANPKHLGDDGTPALAFQFGADEVRRHVPQFSVDPRLADLRQASTLGGLLGFAGETTRRRYAANVSCRHEKLRGGRHSGVELQTCSRTTLIDGLWVTYDVQERNVALVEALDRFLGSKIAEWRNNCHATDRL